MFLNSIYVYWVRGPSAERASAAIPVMGFTRWSIRKHSTPHTFTSGFFSPNFSLSIWQISLRALPCFSMRLMVL